jgi:LacI family transcriptional regulator
VALLVETSIVSGREILKGIGRFLREGHPWTVVHEPRNLLDPAPPWIRQWQGDGIIARVSSPEMATMLKRAGLPVVDVLGLLKGAPFPLVHVHDGAIAELAAQHLLAQRPASLGYYGMAGENWSEQRRDAFSAAVQRSGRHPHLLEVARRERFTAKSQKALAGWLRALPKRAGVMVCNDELANDLLQVCRREGIRVPGEIAVIGVDDDDALCSIACPPLSSIRAAHAEVGYEAAQLLGRLMQRRGRSASVKPVRITPGEVMVRQSSEQGEVADPQLRKALNCIEERGCLGLSVDEVAVVSGLSRSVLQRRFRAHVGETVHEAIQSRRLREGCQLLMETSLPLVEVAERAGFPHAEYFSTVFRSKMGCTPRRYRMAVRRETSAEGR